MKLRRKKSCGILLCHHGPAARRFLVLKRSGSGSWEFPKGGMKQGEGELACAAREIDEECGISDYRLLPAFRDTIHYEKMHHRQPVAKEVVFFLAEVPSTAVRLSDEHQDYRWGEPEQLLPLLKRDVQRGLLLRAIAHLEAAEARSPGRGEEGER